MRLLPLEQRALEDLERWYGPVGSKSYAAAVQTTFGWLSRLRGQLEAGRVGPE